MSIMSAGFGSKSGQLKANAAATRNTGPGSTASFMEGGQQRAATGAAPPLAKSPMTQTRGDRGPGQPADSGPLQTLTNPSKFKSAVFPSNVRAVDHYITIGAYEERHFPAFGESRQNKNIIQKIVLPMPSSLQSGYNQSYQNEAIGITGQVVGSALDDQNFKGVMDAAGGPNNDITDKASQIFTETSKLATNTIDSLGKNINKGVALASALKMAESGAAGLAGTATMGVAGGLAAAGAAKGVQAFAAARGFAANPHTSVIYDSPQLRSFQFDWELRPKSYKESIAISRIVAFFKYFSAPGFKADMKNHFFEYPNQFRLKIKHDEFLFSFGDCVLTAFAVDYHGEGTPIYYDAAGSITAGNRRLKAPAVVRISTAWQETSIVTKEAIETAGR